METCRTCRHWKRPDSEYGEIPGIGTCGAVVQYWDAAEWVANSIKRQLRPEYAGKLAFVQDGSDYHAELNTLPDFGCNQHEIMKEEQ